MKDKAASIHWISTAKAAELLGISRVAIWKKIKAGIIKTEKVGRNYLIPTSEMDRLMGKRGPLTAEDKERIDKAIERAVSQYGTALRMLGKE